MVSGANISQENISKENIGYGQVYERSDAYCEGMHTWYGAVAEEWQQLLKVVGVPSTWPV